MATEKSDHEIDIEFGQWLRDRRTASGLTLEQAAQRTGLPSERLKSIELGYAQKGITQQESQRLCALYRLDAQELLDRATGKISDDRRR